MAGITPEGITVKRLPEVIEELRQRAITLFSDVTPEGEVVDVSDNTALGRMIGVVAPSDADIWEAIQEVYDSFNPAAATGINLDNIVALSGISRLDDQATIAQVLLEGNSGTAINTAVKLSSSTTKRFYTIAEPLTLNGTNASGIGIEVSIVQPSTLYRVSYTLDGITYVNFSYTSSSSTTADAILAGIKSQVDSSAGSVFNTYYKDGYLFIEKIDPFQIVTFATTLNLNVVKAIKLATVIGDEVGPVPQEPNSIDTISTPILGLDSAYNPTSGAVGRYKETDDELRERFRNSKFYQAANILESIIDALINVDGVEDVVVYENDTNTTNALGIPPHSFMPIVLGGLTTSIADAIWKNKPTGIQSYGDTPVTVVDTQLVQHTISFKRPEPVPIYISISITEQGILPGDVVAQIKQRLDTYFEENYSIGDDVVWSRLFTPINEVTGFKINSMTIGKTPSPTGTSNVVIDFDEIANLDPSHVVVTLV